MTALIRAGAMMPATTAPDERLPHVVIGGLGGSGTRVVAALVQSAGIRIGCDLNGALDNLWVTLLFKRPTLLQEPADSTAECFEILSRAMRGGIPLTAAQEAQVLALAQDDRPQHPATWLQERAHNLIAACRTQGHAGPWGWKEPNSHMLLPLLSELPGVRYIHVVRDGLYMAQSQNRNQLWYWGEALTGTPMELSARYALHYWRMAQVRAEAFAERMGPRFLMLDYDRLLQSSADALEQLNRFLGIGVAVDPTIVATARRSPAMDHLEPDDLDPDDVAYALASRGGSGAQVGSGSA